MWKIAKVLSWYLRNYMFHPPKGDLIKLVLILLQHDQTDISQALLAQNHSWLQASWSPLWVLTTCQLVLHVTVCDQHGDRRVSERNTSGKSIVSMNTKFQGINYLASSVLQSMRRAAPCLPMTLMNWSMMPHGIPREVKYQKMIGLSKTLYTSMAMLCCLASKSFVLLRCSFVCSQLF